VYAASRKLLLHIDIRASRHRKRHRSENSALSDTRKIVFRENPDTVWLFETSINPTDEQIARQKLYAANVLTAANADALWRLYPLQKIFPQSIGIDAAPMFERSKSRESRA